MARIIKQFKIIGGYFAREFGMYILQLITIGFWYYGVTRVSIFYLVSGLISLLIQFLLYKSGVRTAGPFGFVSDNWFWSGIWIGGWSEFKKANKIIRLIPLFIVFILLLYIISIDKTNWAF